MRAWEGRAVAKIDKLTWEAVAWFPSAGAAAADAGLPAEKVWHMARNRAMPAGRWVYRFEGEYDPADGVPKGHNAPVDIVDCETGKRLRCVSIKAAAGKLSVAYNTAANAKSHAGHRLFGRYAIVAAGGEVRP